jgi:predicted nucleic acid-binding protein
MKAYLDAGVFIDYLFRRSHSGPYLRSAPRRGRVPAQLGADAEACLAKLRAGHTVITSSLTCYEVEDALYRELMKSAKGVAHSDKFLVSAARAVVPQMLMTVELFSINVIDLTSQVVRAQCGNVDLQMQGIRAADALHLTTAFMSDADIIITGDDHILSLDSTLPKSSGGVLRCVDTDGALLLMA